MQELEYTVVNDEYDPDYRETIFYIVDTDKEDLISEYGETVRFLIDEIKTSNKVIKISKLR